MAHNVKKRHENENCPIQFHRLSLKDNPGVNLEQKNGYTN